MREQKPGVSRIEKESLIRPDPGDLSIEGQGCDVRSNAGKVIRAKAMALDLNETELGGFAYVNRLALEAAPIKR